MELLDIVFYLQGFSTILAIITNMFLVYLIKNNTKKEIGKYNFLLIAFACFEALYSVVVFFGMPTHFMADRSWLVFSYGGFIGDTPFAVLGPGLYCALYGVWVGFVVIHFLYRYIVVCKQEWAFTIEENGWVRVALAVFYCGHVFYSMLCGLYFCTRERLLPDLAEKVRKQFGIQHPKELGYILLRTTTAEGNISIAGVTTILNHYILVAVSVVLIFYCGISIWLKIRGMQKTHGHTRDTRIQRQMFITLVVQTMVPILFCHVPTLVYLTFPFWEDEFSFGEFSTVFSFLTSINKFCDPLIVIFCIGDYRRAALRMLNLRSPHTDSHSEQSDYTMSSTARAKAFTTTTGNPPVSGRSASPSLFTNRV